MANWMVMPAPCDSSFTHICTHLHTHAYTHAVTPETYPSPHSRAVKAGMQKENETGGTSFNLEADLCLCVCVCVCVCVWVRLWEVVGWRGAMGERGFKVSHQFVAVLFLKEANPTAT